MRVSHGSVIGLSVGVSAEGGVVVNFRTIALARSLTRGRRFPRIGAYVAPHRLRVLSVVASSQTKFLG